MQSTNKIFLIRPSHFIFNSQTATTNKFQNDLKFPEQGSIHLRVTKEFETFATSLIELGVNVLVFQDTEVPNKPDAIFPNNWISTHADGTVVLYPMFAANRRLERRQDIVELLREKFEINEIINLSDFETNNQFLEGTGSIVFDHLHKIAYACASPRTNKDLFLKLCDRLGYKPIYFNAVDSNGNLIYHTNVMMCIGEKFVVVCAESIKDRDEKEKVLKSIKEVGHEIITISIDQMHLFAGNMLGIKINSEERLLVLSKTAFDSLTTEQKVRLNFFNKLVPLHVDTIETIGGGSVRCMMAEIFLPSKT